MAVKDCIKNFLKLTVAHRKRLWYYNDTNETEQTVRRSCQNEIGNAA